MKILIDMNLSPQWRQVFEQEGIEALHWSAVRDPRATDRQILAWAREHGTVILAERRRSRSGRALFLAHRETNRRDA